MVAKGIGASRLVTSARVEDFECVGELTARIYVSEGFSSPEAAGHLMEVASKAATADLLVTADSDGRLVGSVVLVLEGPLRQIAEPDEAEVRTLSVEPFARRQGFGEALMRECAARAYTAGRRAIVLSTQPTMVAAQRLYEKLGYERVPTRDWQRSNGKQMLVFSQELIIGE